jgi:hypothetical protein
MIEVMAMRTGGGAGSWVSVPAVFSDLDLLDKL